MDQSKKWHIEKLLRDSKQEVVINLSQEQLSVSDYEWLAKIIKSSKLDGVILPEIKNEIVEKLSLLEDATKKNSTLTKMNIEISSGAMLDEPCATRIKNQIVSRLQRNSRRIFCIHGGGNIGLGLMADIVCKSKYNYRIKATTNNKLIFNLVNSVNKLWLQHTSTQNDPEASCINDVEMVSRESSNILRLYGEASLAAICVTPTVMPIIARDIAKALMDRYEEDGSGLKILVLMNIPNCAAFARENVHNALLLLTGNESYTEKILFNTEFVPTVIDRIVTPISEDKIKLQLKIQLEKVDASLRKSLLNEDSIESILANQELLLKAVSLFNLRFNLFNAEKAFSMYVPDNFREAYRLPLIKMTHDLSVIEAVKNKYLNGPHAILAWIGALSGYSTIADAIKNPHIRRFIKDMMKNEIEPILMYEYPTLSISDLQLLKASFFERCTASTHDTVLRVGRDPLRKLNSGGRVRGTIELAHKHDLKYATSRLEQGIAAGYLYAIKGIDPDNPDCQKIRDIYKQSNNSLSTMLCYNGSADGGDFVGLDLSKDNQLIKNVVSYIKIFDRWMMNKDVYKKPENALSLLSNNHHVASTKIPKSIFSSMDFYMQLFSSYNSFLNMTASTIVCEDAQTLQHKRYNVRIWHGNEVEKRNLHESKKHQETQNINSLTL